MLTRGCTAASRRMCASGKPANPSNVMAPSTPTSRTAGQASPLSRPALRAARIRAAGLRCRSRSDVALDKFVNQILEEFLAAAAVRGDVALLEHIGFEVFEAGLVGFDLRPYAAVPSAVALLDELRQAAIFADCGRRLQTAREGIHAADVGME